MTDRQDINIDALRKTLLEQKEELSRLSASSAESRDAVELDQTRQGRLSRQDALQQQEMAKETERRRKVRLQQIEQTLKRLESDEYGYCVICGEEIAVKRLELDPAVPTCIDCANTRR